MLKSSYRWKRLQDPTKRSSLSGYFTKVKSPGDRSRALQRPLRGIRFGEEKIGVLVGRFQPFHYGHLEAVRFALKRVGLLYILVGSSEKSHEPNNPFTCGERLRMVKAALDEAGLDCRRWLIVAIPDATDHSLWLSHVDTLVPKYDVVFSNDPLTVRLFREGGIKVVEVPLRKREVYSATEVRRRISLGKGWSELVPPSVRKAIREVDGLARLRELSGASG